jgi:hypothetical protein
MLAQIMASNALDPTFLIFDSDVKKKKVLAVLATVNLAASKVILNYQ